MGARTVPIIAPTILTSAPSPGEPMDITTPTNSSAPASATKSPDPEVKANGGPNERPPLQNEHTSAESIIMPAPAAAAPAVHQPKIVQTAFIHKLYKCGSPTNPLLLLSLAKSHGSMLEDKTIQHLISWTANSESFVMQPSHEFSKVLA